MNVLFFVFLIRNK